MSTFAVAAFAVGIVAFIVSFVVAWKGWKEAEAKAEADFQEFIAWLHSLPQDAEEAVEAKGDEVKSTVVSNAESVVKSIDDLKAKLAQVAIGTPAQPGNPESVVKSVDESRRGTSTCP